MEESPRNSRRFSVQRVADCIHGFIDSALLRVADLVKPVATEVDDSVGDVVEDLEEVLGDSDIFDESRVKAFSPKRIEVKAAKVRRKEERFIKAQLRQNACIGERKDRSNRKVSMLRRFYREISGKRNRLI